MQSINKDYNCHLIYNLLLKKSSKINRLLVLITLVGLTSIGFGICKYFSSVIRCQIKKTNFFKGSQLKKQKIANLYLINQKEFGIQLQQKKHSEKMDQKPLELSKIQMIKQQHESQLKEFENWAAKDEWKKIKDAHYDWWMFPVNQNSSSYHDKYNISKQEVEFLKNDPIFMKNYRRAIFLVIQGWGWDLEKDIPVKNPLQNQFWDGYGVRLAKMSDSLLLFEEYDLYKKLKKFFVEHCLPLQHQTTISDLSWLKKTFQVQ